MLRKTIFSSVLVLTAGLFATSATADRGDKGAMHGDKQGKQDVSFQKIDENGDGSVSQSEFQSANIPEVDHQMLDTDNDGQVDQAEFAAFERITDEQKKSGQQQGTDYQRGSQWETDPARQDQMGEDRDY